MNKDHNTPLPYARHAIRAEDIEAVARVLAEDIITRGLQVEQFEASLAAQCGARHAVLFNSGSSALLAACQAAEITPYDRVFVPANTFIATATASIRQGVFPTCIDVDPATGNMDLNALAPYLREPNSRGRSIIMPVHYAGVPVDMAALEQLIQDPETIVIEDAAAALGSAYDKEHPVGSCRWSQMTIFSFHPAKLITTGEGGAVTTNAPELAHRLKRFRNNGIERDPQHLLQPCEGPWSYEVHETTGNFHMTDFQAALGLSQLQRLSSLVNKRQQLVAWYREKLKEMPQIQCILPEENAHIAAQLFVVLIDYAACGTTRAKVMQKLSDAGIASQVHYIPLYRHIPYMRRYGDLSAEFPGMESFYARALTLPLFHGLNEADIDRICTALRAALQ